MRKIILHNIIMERKKKVYNIILNSRDTKSYTGGFNNANYFVDFNTIMDTEALKSSYLVRFRMRSNLVNFPNYNNASSIIALNLGFSSCTYNMSNRTHSRTAGILTYTWESNISNSSQTYYIDTKPGDNPPMYIDSLASTSVINLTLFDLQSSAPYVNNGHYLCILSFEEQ